MKGQLHHDPGFRIAFTFLAATALLLFLWECLQRPAGPSRVDWPARASAKP
jgi:hypothetical protein